MTLRINVTLEDKSARGEERVKAVMFGDVCTNIMGINGQNFYEKDRQGSEISLYEQIHWERFFCGH